MKYKKYSIEILGDLHTPLNLYMRLRDQFSRVLLLESSDYSSRENSRSFLCCDSLSSFTCINDQMFIDGEQQEMTDILTSMDQFLDQFAENEFEANDGIFGYTSFDASYNFQNIKVDHPSSDEVPMVRYDFFRFVLSIDHFKNLIKISEYCPEGEESQLDKMKQYLTRIDPQNHGFSLEGKEYSDMTSEAYMDGVDAAKAHCQRGDVFQLVLSRKFHQKFKGDDLNVYRALRSINPSPYLFYFDYGSYRIFGSSPEAQLKIEDGIAEIHPIAGTFRRTGDPSKDKILAEELAADPKESAEHVMLVDLARNDLSQNCNNVSVSNFKEVQYFSHVIHLVSKVIGQIKEGVSAYKIFADSFPAGTLSGAPKHKALQLIDKYEDKPRGFYGGGIGMLSFNGDLNHASIIRSFVSQNNTLSYQAGAGLVISSDREKELQEVDNKLAALKKALYMAEKI